MKHKIDWKKLWKDHARWHSRRIKSKYWGVIWEEHAAHVQKLVDRQLSSKAK